MENQQMNVCASGNCGCTHHHILPIFMILIGATFLLGACKAIDPVMVSYIWPFLLIVGGIAKMFSHGCGCGEKKN